MTAQTATKTGIYIYAIVSFPEGSCTNEPDSRTEALLASVPGLSGINGTPVYFISHDGITAAVNDVPNEKLRPERRHLGAHQGVLRSLLKERTLLPMSFGIIADGPEDVRRILISNRDVFADQLSRVEGMVEMGLRVVWDVRNIFEFLLGAHPELKALRDQLFGDGREPTQGEKIELGRLFDQTLKEERRESTQRILSVLSPRCSETKENRPREEREVANLVFLIGRNNQKDFEEGVFEAAKLFDDNYTFDFNGPWPPYNFVDVDLQM